MGGVNGPNSRVQIWQTLKQVVVQRCGLTSDRNKHPITISNDHRFVPQLLFTVHL
jgi:hypothetical protein